MGRALRGEPGGIAALLRLDRATWAAVEDELARRGFVLADVPGRLSWRAVLAIVRYAMPGTALAIVLAGPQARWGDAEHLAAAGVHAMQTLAWMQSKDGSRGTNRPAPILPPGVEDPNRRRFGDAAMSLVETQAWLDARNGPR